MHWRSSVEIKRHAPDTSILEKPEVALWWAESEKYFWGIVLGLDFRGLLRWFWAHF